MGPIWPKRVAKKRVRRARTGVFFVRPRVQPGANPLADAGTWNYAVFQRKPMIHLGTPVQSVASQFENAPDMVALTSVGWHGFLDYSYMAESFGALILAVLLGLAIAFHPTTKRTVDTAEEAELPKVYIMYALIGAVIGVVVLKYGTVIGFVVFGLGGLMRFRTEAGSTRDTGRLIIVTLVGLISGLNLPQFAVLATAFAWAMIYIFDGHPVCSLEVSEIPKGRLKDASDAYRRVLAELNCKLISERKSFAKSRIDYVFRAPRKSTQAGLHSALCEKVAPDVRGEIDWEIS
jgi:hypothetical protein